jgi:hypothetical protein
MAFPSTSGTTQKNLSEAWMLTRLHINSIKVITQTLKQSSQAGNVNAEAILTYVTRLADTKAELQNIVTVPGLEAYAKEQINNPSIDIATEYNNVIQALDSVVSWIITNMPKDASGYLLVTQFAPENNGRTISRTFTPAETESLRTVLDSLLITID